jgi:hypothetical protein
LIIKEEMPFTPLKIPVTPGQFAKAWGDLLRDVAEAVAGPDGRISATEAEELKRLSRGPAYTEQAPAALEVDRFVERESLQVRVTAESVASPDGFITPTEARKLPLNLRADYAFLTSTSVSDNDA